MEVIDIKKLFDYKLFMGKCLHPVRWSAFFATTVDTLTATKATVSNCECGRSERGSFALASAGALVAISSRLLLC